MIVLCILVFIYFIFNITSIVNVFMLSIEKKFLLTGKIRKQLNSGNFACGIFVKLQKAFEVLVQNSHHYWRIVNNRFSSSPDLQIWLQYISINCFHSNLKHVHCGFPQSSILGPLLFLIYISDLNCALRYCPIYDCANDINLLNWNNSVKIIKKLTKTWKIEQIVWMQIKSA